MQVPDVSLLVGLGEPPAGEADRYAGAVARDRGLPLWETAALGKHRRLLLDPFDRRCVRRAANAFSADIVHTHVGNDLRLAARGGAGAGVLVHSIYEASLEAVPARRRRLAVEAPAGLVVHSAQLAAELAPKRDRVLVVPPPLDIERFNPERELAGGGVGYLIPPDRCAIGVVARMQPHRQFDLLLEAFSNAVRQAPELLLVIVGRGTRAREVAQEPVRRLGIERDVVFPGYVSGDDYVALLGRFDLFVFLVPGTDGTCRALREAMAMGAAPIGSRRGMISELLGDGACGVVAEEDAAHLSEAMVALAHDVTLRGRLAAAARERAAAFDRVRVAKEVCAFYQTLLANR